jgi:dCMP deaminase
MNGTKWDFRFLALAAEVAKWSKDPSTKVGAVLVRGDRSLVSVGYNGFPAGHDDDPRLYADQTYKYKHVVHAEVNALSGMRDEGRKSKDLTLYSSFPPCPDCVRRMAESGEIRRVVSVASWVPPGKPEYWIEEWSERLKESQKEAHRLGLQMDLI